MVPYNWLSQYHRFHYSMFNAQTGSNMKFHQFCILLWKNINPTNKCMLKVKNRNTRKRCHICLKLTRKTADRGHWHRFIFTVNFEHTLHLFLVFLLQANVVFYCWRMHEKSVFWIFHNEIVFPQLEVHVSVFIITSNKNRSKLNSVNRNSFSFC